MKQPSTPVKTSSTDPATGQHGVRTSVGSNYGDVKPEGNDPSRGSEMERDALPANADFSKPPEQAMAHASQASPGTLRPIDGADADIDASREDRIRIAAYKRYEARGGSAGDPVQDWLDAEAEVANGQSR